MDHQAIISRSELEHILIDESAKPKPLPLSLLEHITSGFSDDNEIGYGGFAVVYKGMLDNVTIAVKKLTKIVDIDEKKFSEEVRCLMKAKHKNIVRFLGYCSDTQGEMLDYKGELVFADVRQRLLCFEYLPRGSLDKQITDASCGLEWRKRYQIINGICDGLCYLHQKRIVHLDLKPGNILLDDNMMPKIIDFGLSRCFNENQTRTIASRVIGTMGYLAPEFYIGRQITFKSDIYSLGMIIIKIVAGEKGYSDVDNVLESWRNRLEKSQEDTQLVQVRVCIEIAIECTDLDSTRRPDIQQIIYRLRATEYAVETGASSSSSVAKETTSDMEEALIVERTEGKQKTEATLSGSIMQDFIVHPVHGFGDRKLPLIEKFTDGITKKHEVDSTGYLEIYKHLLEKMSLRDATPIKFHTLKLITENFSEKTKVGSGAYGEVYKGLLNGNEIGVKKLFPILGLNDEVFENEVRNLKKVQHKNVIRMIGYCYEISHRDVEHEGQLVWSQVINRALCFEYMKGGSLAKHISAKSCIHDWPTTYKIINGTCQGLHYLHKGQVQMTFHLDLKPDNVLLDEELVPKIGDFGLSRLFGSSYVYKMSTMKGTIGFMPPEYIAHGKVTPKHDVFSLGVIIFHIMAGEKGYNNYLHARHHPNFPPKIQQEFIESVQEYWKKKMQATTGYRWDETDLLGVTKCIVMAMSCVEDARDNRPYITEIILELKQLDSKVEEMLKKDPKPRIGQLKTKNHVDDLEAVKQNKSLNDLGKDIEVDPSLELCFLFEPKKDIRCCLQLINKTASNYIAFNISSNINKYRAQPNKGIIAPRSKRYITLTLRAQEAPPNMQCVDVLVVQGIRVSEHFTSDEITKDYLEKASTVYEVALPIVYVALDEASLSIERLEEHERIF